MTKREYLGNYINAESALREMYGELSYFSKPAIHEKDNDIIPVSPWADFIGDPLILPTLDFVNYIAISEITADAQLQTNVYYLEHVLSLLDQVFGVQLSETPVPHLTARIPHDAAGEIRGLVEQLPKINA